MRDELSVLSAFLAVADERSFTRAAKRLNISTSGLSHAIRRLEEQIGVRLLTRTTERVTDRCRRAVVAQLRPALSDIRGVLTTLSGLQSTPVGRVRLLCPRVATKTVIGPKLGQFVRDYPGVELEITSDDTRVDLVSAGYDAGIQFGEYIAQDMVAVRVAGPPASRRWRTRLLRVTLEAGVASGRAEPSVHPLPAPRRKCLQWELDKGDESLTIAVNGSLLLDDVDLVIQAALMERASRGSRRIASPNTSRAVR